MHDLQERLRVAKQQMLRYHLEGRGIKDRRVLDAMARVPRERFVPPELVSEAYADKALPIGCGQTISQPYMVAIMTQALRCEPTNRVLEIGTGSGYQTAILAELVDHVVTVERHPGLLQKAAQLLSDLGYKNVTFVCCDGTCGVPELAPYDRIMVTAGAPSCPPPLFEQLKEGGVIVIPVGDEEGQVLQRISKINGQPVLEHLLPCRFVPLVGKYGWPETQGKYPSF